jgi:hypothetical protein
MAAVSETELRLMVRKLLHDILPESKAAPLAGKTETVRICVDAELQAFIARLAVPGIIEAVREGRMRFTLQPATAPAAPRGMVLSGVISERKLSGCTRASTITLAHDAVLTPLAKDLARQLDLKIERNGQ